MRRTSTASCTSRARSFRVGAIVPCEIVARSDYDLVAAAIGEPR